MFLSGHSVLGDTLATSFKGLLEVKRVPRSILENSEVVLGPSFFESALFEDVPNEITTFRGSQVPENLPETRHNACFEL